MEESADVRQNGIYLLSIWIVTQRFSPRRRGALRQKGPRILWPITTNVKDTTDQSEFEGMSTKHVQEMLTRKSRLVFHDILLFILKTHKNAEIEYEKTVFYNSKCLK